MPERQAPEAMVVEIERLQGLLESARRDRDLLGETGIAQVRQLQAERDEARAERDALARQVEAVRTEREVVHADLSAILRALGLGDHARPYSSHDVVRREVVPTVEALVKHVPRSVVRRIQTTLSTPEPRTRG